jgi:DNA-binding transcriptional ArsR family regulator
VTPPSDDAATSDGRPEARTANEPAANDESETANDESANTDEESVDPAAAFAALSDPLRVDILRELAAYRRETEHGEPIGFADLRRRVEVRDSGRFRYHLNELRDHFVEKAGDGYRLTHAGTAVVAAVLAGTLTDASTTGRAELDSVCHSCGEPAVATCQGGVCAVTCPNDHRLFQWTVPPNVAADATVPEVVDRAELLATQAIERALTGICPTCYDPIESEVRVGCESGDELPVESEHTDEPRLRAVCDTCGGRVLGPVGFCLLVDPEVAAFYRRHGRRLRDHHVWEHSFVEDDAVTVVGTDPVRVTVDVALDDDHMQVTVDGTGSVVGTERRSES